ncbi:coiled-coil domain-containing protein 141-like [Babylonia areolata]|uniref:coiled-coil domain-containing protein 141-like n=1 Tax=Babylonia areolata TaxID=304850 RepID=UPI003FD4218C
MAYRSAVPPSPAPSLRSDQQRSSAMQREGRPGSTRSARNGGHRHSTGSGSSIYGYLLAGVGIEAEHIVSTLQKRLALLTGGRDRQGGPVITFPASRHQVDFSSQELTTCLRYLAQIPSEESKKRGVTVLIDSRDGSWGNLSFVYGCLMQALSGYLKQVVVVQWEDARRHSIRLDNLPPDLQPQHVMLEQLQAFIDPNQLTEDLGGSLQYSHSSWLHNRLGVERFLKEAQSMVQHLDTEEQHIQQTYQHGLDPQTSPIEALRQHRHFQNSVMTGPTLIIRQGHEVLSQLQQSVLGRGGGRGGEEEPMPTLDTLESQKTVKRVIQYLEQRVDTLHDALDMRDKTLNLAFHFNDWKRNVKTVVDWVLGPGEKLMSSHTDIGDSYESAEELRRRHEELEIKCTDTYGQYAELRHTADEMLSERSNISADIKAERDYMDTVCRSFANRLERRRTLLITSVRFHRLAEDFGNRLDDLLELVCSDVVANTVEEVEEALQILQEKSDACETVSEQTNSDGQSLLEEMSRPIKNAFGKDITPDYGPHIQRIKRMLEELQERKMRCDELADVRRLKLQQLLQLRTCERDCDQAIDWIEELCEVMVRTHHNMGNTAQEADALQEDNRKFEATASGTYEYGKQLLQAAMVLRRSLRYPMEPNHNQSRRLEEAWKRFSQGVSERANRLTVCSLFLTASDKVLDGIDKLVGVVAKALAGEMPMQQTARNYSLPRDHLHKEFQDTCQMGRALLERLALPVLTYHGNEKRMSIDEEGASETIKGRLRKLDRKMAEAEHYWEELHKALSDPNYQPPSQPIFPRRQPSERSKVPRTKGKRSAEAEERRRRSDPLGFSRRRAGSSRSLNQDENIERPVRRGQGLVSGEAEGGGGGSQDGSSAASPPLSPQENSVMEKGTAVLSQASAPQTASLSRAVPLDTGPVYENQFVGAESAPPPPPPPTAANGNNFAASDDDLMQQLQQSAEWIRVRVHQMEPDLMDVGSTLEEAIQLQREHQELLARLKSKEGEVSELLRRADTYADSNRSQTDVHGAMADTLAEAWRDLNEKLQYRSKLLEQSVTFHQSAQELSSNMEQVQGNFLRVPLASDVNTARSLLQQHNDMKQSILECSKRTMDMGQSLLNQIKEMGMHADIQNRHATTAACYGIEHLLELLHDKRRHLEELWTQRKIQLEQCLQLCQLDQEVNKILEWFRTVGNSYMQRTDLGENYAGAKYIQEQHNQFEAEAREIQENMLRLLRTADGLLRRASVDAEGIRQSLMLVDQECESFMVRLDNRRKNITMAVSFFNLAQTALNQLDQIEVQLNSMDLPRNSAELAERHSQLSNAIVDASTQSVHEGRLLLERVSSVDSGADGVRRKLEELQKRCGHLESLCKARRAEAWQRSQAYLHFQENYNGLSTWLSQIGHSMLTRHSSMGSSLASAKDFLEVHEQLDEDIRDKNADLEALSAAAMDLVKSGDQEAKQAAERADALHKQYSRLQRVVENRIQLALIYVSFLKLKQQLSSSLDGLQHIVRSETEDLQDLTDTALQQVQSMYSQTEQLFAEFTAKGKLFLQNSSTISDDSTLEVRTAINTVESSLESVGQRMSQLSQQWEAWQQHVLTSKQFKSQWHQFIQDARRTIDHVMKIEREFFLPYISGHLGNSLEKAEELRNKLTEFAPLAKKAQEEIEDRLKTAEMLSLKGDTRGQKEQIVNELLRVHQRFQGRMNEYQLLIKMTIEFFKNVNQLDELIERTEREYLQSQLPTDLQQAESMLEQHKRKKTEISQLINFTNEEGENIVTRVRQQDAEAAAREDVQQVLDLVSDYRRRWESTWDEQERRLRQNLQICQFNYDLRQIHSEIDELHSHLQARRGSYGNSLPAAKMTAQAFNQFEKTVELIEKKIKDFISTAELMVQDEHYDSANIRREIDVLKNKWSTFHTSVRDYRSQLDNSILYFTLIEECEMWMREGSQLLINIGRRAPECRKPQEAADLIRSLERYVEEGKPHQEQRLQKVSELAVQLYGDQGGSKVRPLVIQYQDIMQSFEQADNELTLLKDNLEGKPAQPVEEMMQRDTAAAAAAPMAPKPPRITQHLKNAEVMEGSQVHL